ncbi:MAG: hypothetical protein GY705_24300 [Bacteroidetes bacterium]|nr:hypothetical protein [Bacteroidota bacterium]
MAKFFVIGIGGTGMRCLESFVHLCAMGMYDETEVEMLALDTDRDNGNFRQLSNLVDYYNRAKGVDKEHYAYKDSFFTAKINFHQFSPDYSRQDTGNYARIMNYGDTKRYNPEKADLANLLFTRKTREFDLKHGYRAQTSLGSILMYHAILDEVKNDNNGQLAQYISKLINANQAEKVKVFVMGSVFGGTGASSIPVIPKAFTAATRILAPGMALDNVYFGSVLLTSYFTFKTPSQGNLEKQLVVATADKFALNSQAAMMFYNEDVTVKKLYQKFYMLGTTGMDFRTDLGENEPITGGEKQKNKCHYIELFAAFAAYNFFKSSNQSLETIRNSSEGVNYYYRTIEENGELFFEDFTEAESVKRFARGCGLLTVMSLINYEDDFYSKAQSGVFAKDFNIFGYENIDSREIDGIRKYFELFHFKADNSEVKDGWLRQIYQSSNGKFILKSDLFGSNSGKELRKFKYNKELYKDDFKNHEYRAGWPSNKYDVFRKHFQNTDDDNTITNICEKLTKRIHDTLSELYKF